MIFFGDESRMQPVHMQWIIAFQLQESSYQIYMTKLRGNINEALLLDDLPRHDVN